ncbi:hypothetical protein Tco_1070891 [Tanacetum coccineum]|uniref:Uncharacterized protein n=1 Tax=Tanacetum coccineum TaxID=301880 RepID=A0ABQ5HP25_9ASTR
MSHSTISYESIAKSMGSSVAYTLPYTGSLDPDDEPLGSLYIVDYYLGSEFLKDDPSEDGSIDASSGTDESLPAQAALAIAPESPSTLSPPIAPYR